MAATAAQGRVVDVDTGVVRAGRVLLQRTPAATLFLGFGPQAARLRDLVFNDDGKLDPVARRCRALADAVPPRAVGKRAVAGSTASNDTALDQVTRRLAVIEERARAGFDPSQPRAPKGGPDGGQWTSDGGEGQATREGGDSGAETPASLRPGHYIDELADFVEWIANAKPEDEKAIRREISRYYYRVGDVQGGNALNAALSDAIEPGLTTKDRQEILDSIAPFAQADPAEMGAFTTALAGVVMAAEPPALRGRPNVPTPSAEAPAASRAAAAAEDAAAVAAAERPSQVWNLGWTARRDAIHEALGANLHRSWKTIDDFRDGVVTSMKSIDLRARTYSDAKRLTARINKNVDLVAEYQGGEGNGMEITSDRIVGRKLNLAVPLNAGSLEQLSAIAEAATRARTLGVELLVTPF